MLRDSATRSLPAAVLEDETDVLVLQVRCRLAHLLRLALTVPCRAVTAVPLRKASLLRAAWGHACHALTLLASGEVRRIVVRGAGTERGLELSFHCQLRALGATGCSVCSEGSLRYRPSAHSHAPCTVHPPIQRLVGGC